MARVVEMRSGGNRACMELKVNFSTQREKPTRVHVSMTSVTHLRVFLLALALKEYHFKELKRARTRTRCQVVLEILRLTLLVSRTLVSSLSLKPVLFHVLLTHQEEHLFKIPR